MEKLPDGPKFDALRKTYKDAMPELAALLPLITKKVGMIFTDEPVFSLKPKIEDNKVSAAARVGILAPCDVVIPPGPTGMDPS
jgi:large subunit ribosomal protein LP0